jgi:phenylacetate-coenzyme A ligase PaaK-like adenylate-forming protein
MNTAEIVTQEEIFGIKTEDDFKRVALRVFKFQYTHCLPYRRFCELIKCDVNQVKNIHQIPFMPIQFFKSYPLVCGNVNSAVKVFKSSGTTGSVRSQHYVLNLSWYKQSFLKGFEFFYGRPEQFTFIALLPSYLEQGDSSLVYMCNELIGISADHRSGFYEVNEVLCELLLQLENEKKVTILMGVSYALLDLIEAFPTLKIPSIIVMETGGMKGRRKEVPKEELHQLLMASLGVSSIHSEYGMTELLSQGYSTKDGFFQFPPWMRVFIRESNDPLAFQMKSAKAGGVNIIDLANYNSCSFIATQDLGKLNEKGLTIVGRFDHSDIRGCNLMMDLN